MSDKKPIYGSLGELNRPNTISVVPKELRPLPDLPHGTDLVALAVCSKPVSFG
jgi:hypothetical protein